MVKKQNIIRQLMSLYGKYIVCMLCTCVMNTTPMGTLMAIYVKQVLP